VIGTSRGPQCPVPNIWDSSRGVVIPKGASSTDVVFTLLATKAVIGIDRPMHCATDDAFDFADPDEHVELGFLGVAVLPATDPIVSADSEGTATGALFELPRVRMPCYKYA
jgi:hypothetical protein